MGDIAPKGIIALLPVFITLALAFKTKDAVFSLVVGCIVGVCVAGYDPATGLAKLFQASLGNADFIWVAMIEVAVGIMIALYMRANVIAGFADWTSNKIKSRRGASAIGWILGIFIFFSDYFSPLFCGPICRPITDKHNVSREMLAYELDSGSGPVCTLVPLSGWAVYMAGLLKGQGPITTAEQGMSVFIQSIPYNFYGWLAVIACGLFACQIIPNFGPMKKAEDRAKNEGKVLRDGAVPLAGPELDDIKPIPGKKTNIILFLVIPVMILICIAVGTFIILHSVKILEAFFVVVLYQSILMAICGYFKDVRDYSALCTSGIKAVLPAILILALAYCINTISKGLGAQTYVMVLTAAWMTPALLPALTFISGACISFFTGTSWGTYAILVPFSVPMALGLSGGKLTPIVFITVAAIMGGGLFGDHCSPVSDTTCLSSFGAACDHMDHVATQLPYAFICAVLAAVMFAVLGMTL